jgi:transposase-like protein
MAIVVVELLDVKPDWAERPAHCPYCEGETFQRWGGVRKRVQDMSRRRIRVYRYRCCSCRRTFRDYPSGSSQADQTERLKRMAVICWTLGLSYRSVSHILSVLGVWLLPMSLWRDAQEQAQSI